MSDEVAQRDVVAATSRRFEAGGRNQPPHWIVGVHTPLRDHVRQRDAREHLRNRRNVEQPVRRRCPVGEQPLRPVRGNRDRQAAAATWRERAIAQKRSEVLVQHRLQVCRAERWQRGRTRQSPRGKRSCLRVEA